MLKVISTEEFEKILEDIDEIDGEYVSILECYNRVLSEDIVSNRNIPGFKRSSVDGYALKSNDTYLCSDVMPAILKIKEKIEIGKKPKKSLEDMECSYITTGAMIPNGADGVVMIEDTEDIGDEVLVNKPVSRFQNVVFEDDDIKKESIVLKKGRVIGPAEIGVISSLGINKLKVKRKLRVGIISTGDELLGIDDEIEIPKIKDINGPYLTYALIEDRCISKYYGILNDVECSIEEKTRGALLENDIVILSGGSSAGNKDFTEMVMKKFGEVLFHGLSIKPGKPTLMAKSNEKIILGLPGHPLACSVVYKFIVTPLINKIYGKENIEIFNECDFGENYHKARGREEFLPVTIVDNVAYPMYSKSSAMSIMTKCTGFIRIPRDIEGLQIGDKVKVLR